MVEDSAGSETNAQIRLVRVTCAEEDPAVAIDAEVVAFNEWVGRVAGQPLISVEEHAVRSYLHWRLNPQLPR